METAAVKAQLEIFHSQKVCMGVSGCDSQCPSRSNSIFTPNFNTTLFQKHGWFDSTSSLPPCEQNAAEEQALAIKKEMVRK